MTPQDPTGLRAAREEAIDALCRGFAADALSLGELERRLDRARAARSREELRALLEDVAPRTSVVAGEAGAWTHSPRDSDVTPEAKSAPRGRAPARPGPSRDPTVRPSSHLAFAVMGGTRRAGRWVPPAKLAAVALMGAVELDFRKAVLRGDVERAEMEVDPRPDAPTIRVNGFALMGGVEVKVADSR